MKFIKSILMLSLLLCANAAFADVAIIVNPANNQTIDKSTIKRLFLAKMKAFPDGSEVQTAGLPADDATTLAFYKNVLGKRSSQMKSYWTKLIFTGTGEPTKEYATSAQVISVIKSNANAIGYIDAGAVTADVKVIGTY